MESTRSGRLASMRSATAGRWEMQATMRGLQPYSSASRRLAPASMQASAPDSSLLFNASNRCFVASRVSASTRASSREAGHTSAAYLPSPSATSAAAPAASSTSTAALLPAAAARCSSVLPAASFAPASATPAARSASRGPAWPSEAANCASVAPAPGARSLASARRAAVCVASPARMQSSSSSAMGLRGFGTVRPLAAASTAAATSWG
mmetsp:Transcript_16747/g.65420  ORF Transcript_16747/g.65420 Transcript_16747/m.65420 type:complete len:209 (+) Transcript_16747:842-1468(+)